MKDALTLMSKGRELRKILDQAYDLVFEIRQQGDAIQDEGEYFKSLSRAIAKVLIKADEMLVMSSQSWVDERIYDLLGIQE
jgi:hypothetical protein